MAKKLQIEFLVPLRYGNGKNVGEEKITQVRNKIVGLFGAVTIHSLATEGLWTSPKTHKKSYDECKKFEISVDKKPGIEKTLKKLKEMLKEMFEQEDIYMYSSEITTV